MDAIELYLSPADDKGQTLEGGLDGSSLAETGAEQESQGAQTFRDAGGDPNSLADQGWAVVIPDNDHGNHLLEVVKPLIDKRSEDMEGDEVTVFRVPPHMSAPEAVKWIDQSVVGNQMESEIPAYALLLGDFDHISLETQHVLSTECHTGRIGFQTDQQYESYVDKLLRWEQAERDNQARAVFFCAKDGTAATELGDRLLIRPTVADAHAQLEKGRFPVSEILDLEDEDPIDAGNRLLEAAGVEHPSILFSCSHGMGAPRRGWKTFDRQRALQGAICLGDGEHIDANALVDTPFLPGGMWMFFACFGAGTPAISAYSHWLSKLKKVGQFGGKIDPVLASLPRDGDPAFIAALPQTVLANPNGPLAVVGHIDLAWSYSFQDLDKKTSQERHRRFQPLISQWARGSRAGVALGALLRAREQIKTDITISADVAARAEEMGGDAPDDRVRLGHRWMLHQDLDGYVLLGDPAARLAVNPRSRKPAKAKKAAASSTRVVTAPASIRDQPAKPAATPTSAKNDEQPANESLEQTSDAVATDESDGPVTFGIFSRKKDKEPGFFVKFSQRITNTMSKLVEDAVTLEVKTYVGDDVDTAPKIGDDMGKHPNVKLHAYTRCNLDGDIDQMWSKNENMSSEQQNELRTLHLEMVKNAQEHRNELLRILLNLIRPGSQ